MAGMLARLQQRFFARRLATEPRDPDVRRIPYSGMTLAGLRVTPDLAATVSAVWACRRYISQNVAMLPWRVMRETDEGGEKAPTHPVDWLLWKRPSLETSAFQLRETLIGWALFWGNGYAEIEVDLAGRPMALWLIHPERVDPWRDEAGKLWYRVANERGGYVDLPPERIFHIRGFGDGPVGVNVMAYAAQSIGWARAAQLFGAAFFGNGMNIAGIVQVKKRLLPAAFDRLKEELKGLYGGIRNAGKSAVVLDGEMEWKPVQIDPEKGQFIATNQHLVNEVCRWFGCPPHKVMHLMDATYSNIESQSIEVVIDCLMPWVKRFEEEADFKLFGPQNRQGFYSKMNINALMRGDSAARATYFQVMRNIGAFSVNDILKKEDENTIGPDGDKRVMQGQYTTLDRIGEEPAVAPAADPAEQQQAQAAADQAMAMLELIHVG